MAAFDVTKKLSIYHTLYRLNRSFASIVEQCATLRRNGVFQPKAARQFQGLAQELQSEINQHLLGTMQETELGDWTVFGKVRKAREKELRGPDNGSIHAKERRKDMAKRNKRVGS